MESTHILTENIGKCISTCKFRWTIKDYSYLPYNTIIGAPAFKPVPGNFWAAYMKRNFSEVTLVFEPPTLEPDALIQFSAKIVDLYEELLANPKDIKLDKGIYEFVFHLNMYDKLRYISGDCIRFYCEIKVVEDKMTTKLGKI